jgi:hypothetical protein
MKITDIVNEQTPVNRRSPIDQMPLGFGGGGAGGGSPLSLSGGGAGAAPGQAANVWRSGRTNQPMTPSFGATTAPAVTKQSTLGSAPARPGPAAEPSRARQTYSPTTGQTAVPKRSQSMGRSLDDPKYWEPPPAPGERAATLAAAGVGGAALGTGIGTVLIPSLIGRETTPPAGPSTPPSPLPATRPAVPSPATRPAVPEPVARPAVPAPVARPARGSQQGSVGSDLSTLSGGEFASRADRLNQARVDAILGPGYKAGSAAANTALRDYYKANPPMSDAQRQELGQQNFNQSLERIRQQAADAQKDLERDNPRLRTEPSGSDNSTVTVPEDKNQLMRLLKLSGQR